MPLESIYLNSPHVVAVKCDNRQATGKEKWHKVKFEKSTKMIAESLQNKKKTKQNKTKKRQNGNQILNQKITKM